MLRSIIKRIKSRIFPKKEPLYKNIRIGEFNLKALYDSKIDEFLSLYPNYSVNFARLASWILQENKAKTAIIDIGANIGDTVALLRSFGVMNQIYCIEGDTTYFELLKVNSAMFENIILIHCFLSDRDQPLEAKIENFSGTAKLIKGEKGDIIHTKALDSLSEDLRLENVCLLKVDTDGFDIAILNGALQLIERDHPVIFFEYDNSLNNFHQSCLEFLYSLADRSYKYLIFYDNFGKMVMPVEITQTDVLSNLDHYIKGNKGAYSYYDVAVFPVNQELLFRDIVLKEREL